MNVVRVTTWFQFTQGQCLFCHQGRKEWQNRFRLFCRFGHYCAVDLVIILPQFGKFTLPHLHVNVAVYFAQILKVFARIMANFSALGRQPLSCIPMYYAYAHNVAYSVYYAQRQVSASLWNARAYSRRSTYIKSVYKHHTVSDMKVAELT